MPDCNLTKETLFWSSLGALHVVLIAVESGCRGVGDRSAGIFAPQSWNDFASGSTPSGPMVKWMAKADPAHQIGLQPTLHAILISVESGGGGVEELVSGDFYCQKFGMVLLVAPRTMILWYNAFPGTALVFCAKCLDLTLRAMASKCCFARAGG